MSVPLMAGAAALVALVALIVVVRFGIWPTPTPTHAPFTPAPTSAAVTLPPTDAPTLAPTAAPTAVPTDAPTEAPTAVPTDAPSAEPTRRPATAEQSGVPTVAGTDTDQWLLDAVGTRPDVVAPCAISTEGFATGQIAQVNCNLSGAGPITSATFLLFESRDAMDAYMNTQVDRSYGNSTACGPKKQWWFTSTPATIEGLVWCGTGPNADGAARTWLQWTEDGNRILGSLSVADVTPQQLYDEWFKADFAAAS